MTPVDVVFWKNTKAWTLTQLFFLLRGWNPVDIKSLTGEEHEEIRQAWSRWRIWAVYCPLVPHWDELDYMHTSVDSDGLLRWAESLEGVNVPEVWHSLYKLAEQEDTNQSATEELGERERENLLKSIAVLAMALAENTGPRTGTKEKPTYVQVAELCRTHVQNVNGLSVESLRKRISAGMKLL